MIAEENREVDARPLAPSLKLSTKASAFSIAAIIGEQSLARASDNVSPSGKNSMFELRHRSNILYMHVRFSFFFFLNLWREIRLYTQAFMHGNDWVFFS